MRHRSFRTLWRLGITRSELQRITASSSTSRTGIEFNCWPNTRRLKSYGNGSKDNLDSRLEVKLLERLLTSAVDLGLSSKKGARVERVPKFSAKATNDKVEGNPV